MPRAFAGTRCSLAWLFPGCAAVKAAGLCKQGSGESLLTSPVAKSLGKAQGCWVLATLKAPRGLWGSGRQALGVRPALA